MGASNFQFHDFEEFSTLNTSRSNNLERDFSFNKNNNSFL